MSSPQENWLLTDSGNAQSFAERFHKQIKYNRTRGKWMEFDGRRWNAETGEGAAQRMFRDMAKVMWNGIANNRSPEGKRELFKWAVYSNSTTGMRNTLTLAKKEEQIEVFEGDFDKHPYLLNCLNGTINLRSGEIKEHDPNDLITQVAPVVYDSEAISEDWERFLEDTTGGDADLRRFLMKAVGYSANGTSEMEKMFLCWGPKDSGKSTFMEAVKKTLGGYVKTADFNLFLQKPGKSQVASPDMARLHDARLVASSEIEDGQRLTEGLFKRFTGGDTIQARFLYKESFEFVPQFTLWLMTNKCPKIKSDSDPTWKRILRVPFAYTVPPEKKSRKLKKTLINLKISGPAILAWIVKGSKLFWEEGLEVPEVVKRSTEDYRESQRPLKDFFEDECEFGGGPEYYVTVKAMRIRYEQWGIDYGVKLLLQARSFNIQMSEAGLAPATNKVVHIMKNRTNVAKCWIGIRLKGDKEAKNEE